MSRSSGGQGHTNACLWRAHDLSNYVWVWSKSVYSLLEENETLTLIVYDAGRSPNRTESPIYKPKCSSKNPAKTHKCIDTF